jgi:hypothetical protein
MNVRLSDNVDSASIEKELALIAEVRTSDISVTSIVTFLPSSYIDIAMNQSM